MKQRIIFGLIALSVLFAVALSDAIVIKIAYVVMTLLAISELWNLIIRRGDILSPESNNQKTSNGRLQAAPIRWAIFLSISALVAACFYCILLLRMLPDIGAIIVWLAFLGAFVTDTFAYLFGMLIGQKHGRHIFPKISPKKTDIGCLGGIIGTTILFLIWGLIGNWLLEMLAMAPRFNINNLVLCGFLCSFIAQIGDLSASWLKRKFGAKDFGSILPGHGGVLDRCDSLLLTAPFVLLFNYLMPIIDLI